MQNGRTASDFSAARFLRRDTPEIAAPPVKINLVEESSEEEIDIKMIITKKPKPKVVREFFRAALANIKSEDELLFD